MSGFAEGTPTVVVELGGQERELGFTLGAMRRVREQLGTLEFDTEDSETMLRSLPAYLWACMGTEDRASLTVEDVEDMIYPGNMAGLSDKVAELFQASLPEGAEGNAPKAARKGAAKK